MSSRHLFYQLPLFSMRLPVQSAPSGLLALWAPEGKATGIHEVPTVCQKPSYPLLNPHHSPVARRCYLPPFYGQAD